MLYPTIASWFSQYNQSLALQQQSVELTQLGEEERLQTVARAEQYNRDLLAGAAVDPFSMQVANTDSQRYQDYLGQLHRTDSGIMARIRIPSINVDLPVYHGTAPTTLEHGVGHLFGTALPVGGSGTHSVLTAHRGLPEAELFTHLDRVREGDLIEIVVYDQLVHYRVTGIQVVLPHETSSLVPVPGADLLTLVTCTPYAVNSHRLLVTGERVEVEENRVVPDRPDIPGFPWWTVWVGGTGILLAAYIGATPRNPGAARDRTTAPEPADPAA